MDEQTQKRFDAIQATQPGQLATEIEDEAKEQVAAMRANLERRTWEYEHPGVPYPEPDAPKTHQINLNGGPVTLEVLALVASALDEGKSVFVRNAAVPLPGPGYASFMLGRAIGREETLAELADAQPEG